jgi:hypothetical protein
MPPFTHPLNSPPPGAKSFHGVSTLENGLTCTYHIADFDQCAIKKAKFIADGPDSVIIISDFDRTISSSFYLRTFSIHDCSTYYLTFHSLSMLRTVKRCICSLFLSAFFDHILTPFDRIPWHRERWIFYTRSDRILYLVR